MTKRPRLYLPHCGISGSLHLLDDSFVPIPAIDRGTDSMLRCYSVVASYLFCLVWPVVKVQLTFFSLSYLLYEYSLPFLSCLVGTPTPTPSPASKCAPPPPRTKGGSTLAYRWGGGGPNSDDWRRPSTLSTLWSDLCRKRVPMIVFSYLWHLSVCYSHSGPVGRGILEQTAPLNLQMKVKKKRFFAIVTHNRVEVTKNQHP